MYVPPYRYVLKKIGVSETLPEPEAKVEVPIKFVKMLLQFALANQKFDEQYYLAAHADVAKAVAAGDVESGFFHYLSVGYFEGRDASACAVDEDWYLMMYTDIAQAIKSGQFESAAHHFRTFGAVEGRAPNRVAANDIKFWEHNVESRDSSDN